MTGFNHRSVTFWNLCFHYAAIVLALVQGVLLIPLYLRYIPMAMYGAWLATGNIALWLTLLDPGIGNLIQQRVAEAYGKGTLRDVGNLTVGAFYLSLFFSLGLLAIGFVIAPHVAQWIKVVDPIDAVVISRAFQISTISSAVMIFAYVFGAVSMGLQGIIPQGIVGIFGNVVGIVTSVVALNQGFGIMAIPLAALLRAIIWTGGTLLYLRFRLRREGIGIRWRVHPVRWIPRLSGLAFTEKAFASVAGNIDSFLVARWLGHETVAALNVTRKPFEILADFLVRPSMAVMPALAHLYGSGKSGAAQPILVRSVCALAWVLALSAGGLLVFNKALVQIWFGPMLYVGDAVNASLVGAFILAVVVASLSNLCWALGNIVGNCWISIWQNALAVALLVPAIHWFGLFGVILAPAFSRLVISLGYYVSTFLKLLDLDKLHRWVLGKESLRASSLAAALALAFGFFRPENKWAGLTASAVSYCGIYSVILIIVSPAFRSEAERVVGRMRTRFGS